MRKTWLRLLVAVLAACTAGWFIGPGHLLGPVSDLVALPRRWTLSMTIHLLIGVGLVIEGVLAWRRHPGAAGQAVCCAYFSAAALCVTVAALEGVATSSEHLV